MIVMYPLMTEKALKMVEKENKLTFIVDRRAAKPEIRKELEERFGLKIVKMNVMNDQKNRKKVIVKLHPSQSAIDIATNFGMM